MKKNNIIALVVIIVIIILGIFAFKYNSKTNKVEETPVQKLDKESQADTTAQIDASLNSVNSDDTSEQDLNSVDADLKTL